MKKCALCGQYYGPFSMEKHLAEDHAVSSSSQDIYEKGYNDGHSAGFEQGARRGVSPSKTKGV
jgi:flagellar biosynthesis/type III secretory pathway protein FliH